MLFRRRRLTRALACFCLLELGSSLLAPPLTFALMGPSQPEFTSYESAGSTDMVNLTTGDFSFSVPLLDIPGPERSFSLPLTYKAGIALEQEASWVGLGWSLNAGAIARSVNGYPDDANNEPIRMTYHKPIDRGWSGGFPGFIELGWNSQTGHAGSVDLLGLAKVGWDKDGLSEADVVGINYRPGEGFGIDPVRMVTAVYTIATFGAATPFTIAAQIGIQAGTSLAITTGLRALGVGTLGGVVGFNTEPTRDVQNHWWGDNYWNFFNNDITENAFGSLHFGQMSLHTPQVASTDWRSDYMNGPIIHRPGAAFPRAQPFHNSRQFTDQGNIISETAADVYQDGAPRDNPRQRLAHEGNIDYMDPHSGVNDYRVTNLRPISIAHDQFSVMGEQVSGSIRPHRLEVGSIAYPKLGGNPVDDNGTARFTHGKYMVVPFLTDYKVGFRYENALSNTYTYHPSGTSVGHEPEGFDYVSGLAGSGLEIRVTDPKLLGARTEPARPGLRNPPAAPAERQLIHGKHVVWYTNAEISALYQDATARASSGFLEFQIPTPSQNSANPFRQGLPPSGIGAFAVTAEDGTTYHYSLPVYQFKTFSEANEVDVPGVARIGDLGRSTRTTGEPGQPTNPSGASATTWLLTAITSADYIDRNSSGTVDAADWGGWVQFTYGKFAAQYKWRQPYIGSSYSDESPQITALGYTEGVKETYYLNSISTRSHTALFIKSVRQDGRGHFRTTGTSNLGINEELPSSSLRLDEIVLLDNATLTTLQTPNGIRAPTDPNPVPALSTATYPAHVLHSTVRSTDSYNTVFDTSDLTDENTQGSQDTRIRDYLYAHCIKRTRLNYDYALCQGVPSSFNFTVTPRFLPPMSEAQSSAGRGGKLTLNSVSFFGPTTGQTAPKIIPDFTFDYNSTNPAANPPYHREHWDAFGMYSADGRQNVTSHRPTSTYPAPWSLTRIVSPLGAVTQIDYERDQYAHVSEFGTSRVRLTNPNGGNTFTVGSYPGSPVVGDLRSVLKESQTVYLAGEARYSPCYPPNATAPIPFNRYYLHTPFVISNISTGSPQQITFTTRLDPDVRLPCESGGSPESSDFEMVVPWTVTGGDVRVAQITTTTEGKAYRVRYKYIEDLNTSTNPANSTGVLAKEPPFLQRFKRPENELFDYPSTPVLYRKVTVLRGLFRNSSDFRYDNDDYDTREVYTFHPPTTGTVSEPSPRWHNVRTQGSGSGNYPVAFKTVNNLTEIRTGLIGQPQEVQVYNRQGQQELRTSFTYTSEVTNPNNIAQQGQFTEGVLSNETMYGYRINRSTKTYFPAVLHYTESYRNGVRIKNENTLRDFYTGQPVETLFRNSRNEVYHTRSVPAYTQYGAMGPKGTQAANSHMLTQQTASYVLKEKPGGAPYNPLDFLNPNAVEVLGAGVQTWGGDWTTYRAPTTDPNAPAYADAADSPRPVWRERATYRWQSPRLTPTGAFHAFVNYSWQGALDPHWVKANETVRYDHYSHALETQDVNHHYSAQKTGYQQAHSIAAASPARYTELAYTGAEDVPTVINGLKHFGGEIVSDGTQAEAGAGAPAPHTGAYSTRLAAGQTLRYQAQHGTEVTVGKTYRLSAWMHGDPAANLGRLYVYNNGSFLKTTSITAATTKKAGAWYRLMLTVTIPATITGVVEFGCLNTAPTGTAGVVYVDDFRVCPLTATMTSNVYDPRTNQLLYTLDNENLYTRYQYNSIGRLVRIYREAFDKPNELARPERLIKEYAYNYGGPTAFRSAASFMMVTRDDCPAGEPTSPIRYDLPEGTFTSIVSQSDANRQAQEGIYNLAQAYARANLPCVCAPEGTIIGRYCETISDPRSDVKECHIYEIRVGPNCTRVTDAEYRLETRGCTQCLDCNIPENCDSFRSSRMKQATPKADHKN